MAFPFTIVVFTPLPSLLLLLDIQGNQCVQCTHAVLSPTSPCFFLCFVILFLFEEGKKKKRKERN